MDAKKIVKTAVNVVLRPAEAALNVVNKADAAVHKVTDTPMTATIHRVERKGTQADHHVTDHTNHTQTVKPSVPLPPEGAKRPMVGNDKSAAKTAAKNGTKSWNNGYTN